MPLTIFWFRRDLRFSDNAGLYHALRAGLPVLPVFVFDTYILDELHDKSDARVSFIYKALARLQAELRSFGSSLLVKRGKPEEVFETLMQAYEVKHIFTNRDYEPYALKRDEKIAHMARRQGIGFHAFKDQVIFDGEEVHKDDGSCYTVFTPYYRKWMASLSPFYLQAYPNERYAKQLLQWEATLPALNDIGFRETTLALPPYAIPAKTVREYEKNRDFPFLEQGTSRLGVHLRFGTISIRRLASYAQQHSAVYLKELVWREFYQMILQCFAQVGENRSFKEEYDAIAWRNKESEFACWKAGKTGFPLVDAGMRELAETGFMHNRVRMITASFLTKNLLIDWRWGEGWFAEKLLDYDFASNNGGWQWAAGCGCDAAPYFRIFNPLAQAKKFDPDEIYIRKWVARVRHFGISRTHSGPQGIARALPCGL